jgi:prepilin-type processing-associated H-X9-DG protein
MKDMPRECRRVRRLLRQYELGTLKPSAYDRVEQHVAACEGCSEALVAERKAIATLGRMRPVEPSRDLTAAVMDKVRRAEEEPVHRPAFRVPALVYQYVIVVAIIGILASILLPALTGAREAARRASSANNLKQLGLVFKMYANENEGQFPPLTPYKDVWMVDLERLHPEYLSDLTVLVRPDLPDAAELLNRLTQLVRESPIDWEEVTRIAARSYTYTNWLVRDDSEVEELKKGYMQLARADLDADFQSGNRTFYHLREGIERFIITDINNPAASTMTQSEVPVMFETVRKEQPSRFPRRAHGYNVLYLDGHVAFLNYGERFPATGAVADAFATPRP